MKLYELIALLKELKAKGWKAKLTPSNELRLSRPGKKHFCFCPITAACFAKTKIYFTVFDFETAAEQLRMKPGPHENCAGEKISVAADNIHLGRTRRFFGRSLRRKLLSIWNLKEAA